MKIGIVTYHRTLNYGACLQAVATRVALENLGHEVYYVDYWPKYHSQMYKTFSLKKFVSFPSLGWKYRYIQSVLKRKKRNDSFDSFLNKYIIPYCQPVTTEFDAIVYGSDQIWRKQKSLHDYNDVYFARNSFKTKINIAFSASMGLLPNNDEDTIKIKNLLSNFDKLSVREEDLYHFVKSLGYKDVQLTLDPTLLFTSQEWDEIIETEPYTGKAYVLVYSIGRPSSSFNLESIRKYASMHNLELKILCGTPETSNSEDYITTANPFDFLKLIRNADSVFTSSFHGLVFSLLYNRDVYASFSHNSNRAKTLLDSLGMPERLIAPQIKVPSLKKIDYNSVHNRLQSLKELSSNFLMMINKYSNA